MIKRLALISILLLFSAIQMVFFVKRAWSPDLVLLFVVYMGIFRDAPEAIAAGIAAGLIKGWFSFGGQASGIFIFSAVAVISWLSARLFYRHNPLLHLSMAAIGYCCVVVFQVFCVNAVNDTDVPLMSVLFWSMPSLFITSLLAPPVFYAMSALGRGDD